MNGVVKGLGKGAAVSAVTAVIALTSVGFYLALMLLVIAMEEGGENLTVHALPFAQTTLLLAQGIGFDWGAFRLTITPLLLTLLIIGMIRAWCLRWGTGWPVFLGGLCTWMAITAGMAGNVEVTLIDPWWLMLVKSAAVFIIGFGTAAFGSSATRESLSERYRALTSAMVRRIGRVSAATGAIIIAIYLILGAGTVLMWAIRNHGTVAELFSLADMQIGSRILTTIACVVWLPNLCLWGLSWVFGGGFSVGDVATFTLWISRSDGLPTVPMFGVFPDAVDNDPLRIVLMLLPLVIGLIAGLTVMLLPRCFGIGIPRTFQEYDHRSIAKDFICSAVALCLTAAMVSVAFAALFACSNGALGHQRLGHVGVDVMQSTRIIGQATLVGLFTAWLLVLVGVYAVFGIRWARERHTGQRRERISQPYDGVTNHESAITPRVVNSTHQAKEEQGDNNESAD